MKEKKLIATIKSEFERPEKAPHSADAPIIFRERTGFPKYSHYYVVWEKFEGIDHEARYSIVYRAVQEELGKAEALRTVTAIGVTQEEARGMGLPV